MFPLVLLFHFNLIFGLFFLGPIWLILGPRYGTKTVFESWHINRQLLFCENCSISTLPYSFEFVCWCSDGGGFPNEFLVPANYSFGCFVDGIVVVVGL